MPTALQITGRIFPRLVMCASSNGDHAPICGESARRTEGGSESDLASDGRCCGGSKAQVAELRTGQAGPEQPNGQYPITLVVRGSVTGGRALQRRASSRADKKGAANPMQHLM